MVKPTLGAVCCLGMAWVAAAEPPRQPNVVLIVADDLGYSDAGCFGSKEIPTPNLDRMAAEGTRFTDFYVAQAVCSASRAAFLSGCYSNRVSMQGALNHTSRFGINPDEWLLPEMCKAKGYSTAIYGKWHLGTMMPMFSPLNHGFDDFFGIPYSNDNSKYHPSLASVMPPLPLYDGLKVVETDPDQHLFTRRFTERAVDFIQRNKDKPFFLYVPHVMPHVPIFASDAYEGKTGAGLYADVVAELDHGIGRIFETLRAEGIDGRTFVIFFSDNGPFLSYGNHAGHAVPLREGKLTTFEGGVRVPCIMRWPGQIPSGRVCDEPLIAMDLLPTIARLISAPLPEKKIDGLDIWPVLAGQKDAHSPHESLVFYAGGELQAIRSGDWKLHFAHRYITVNGPPGKDGKPANWEHMKPVTIKESGIDGIASRHGYRVESIGLSLFNLRQDVGEARNVAAEHPEIVQRLSELAEPMRKALGDAIQGVTGAEVRPAGEAP